MTLGPAHRLVLRELRRFNLPERQRLLADWLLELTLGADRETVTIPRLQWLEDLTGLDRAAVSRAIAGLEAARILQVTETEEGRTYRILPDSAMWRERERCPSDRSARGLEAIASFNSLAQLLIWPPERGLPEALAETFLGTVVSSQGSRGVVDLTTVGVVESTMGKKSHPDAGGSESPQPEAILAARGEVLSNRQHPPFSPPSTPPLAPFKSYEAHSYEAFKGTVQERSPARARGEDAEPQEKAPTSTLGPQWREQELLGKCLEVLGADVMQGWGGLWRNRARSSPGKLERVLNAVALDQREGKPIRSPGGYANDLFTRFAD